jgi:PTS system nitrogen regulatory IIA component
LERVGNRPERTAFFRQVSGVFPEHIIKLREACSASVRLFTGMLMNISELLAPDAILPSLKAQSKKQLLQELAARAHAQTHLPERRIFETLVERERLGTTGVGQGIAIPHGRMAEAKTITGLFARMENPIDYDAVDNQPVDLVFMLLAPENAGADHLKALARVSRLLRNQAICEKLRAASTAEALYAILTGHTDGGAGSQAA